MKRLLSIVLSSIPFILPLSAQVTDSLGQSYSLLNANNLFVWVRDDGLQAKSPIRNDWGVMFPRLTAGGLVYSDGLVWVGKVYDGGAQIVRTGGGAYVRGTAPGRIVRIIEDPAPIPASKPRVFRIRRTPAITDLKQDASSLLGIAVENLTAEQVRVVDE